jgi:3alpha(or 20beta)-hydroxysteroid dehydrogenase
VRAAVGEFGRLDGLVNNAAILWMGAIEHTPAAEMERVLRVNLLGGMLGTKAVIPALRAAGGGSIVNVTSIEALGGMNSVGAYTASKWGARGFTKSAAIELGRDGIRVNSVCPAGGNVQMYGPWMKQIVGFIDETRAYSNNRGIPGEAPLEQIAQAVVFFASDASRHCTGVDLPVDGGASAGRFIPGFNTL